MSEFSLLKRSIAELIGTYVLVFLGTGSVVTAVLLLQGWSPVAGNSFNVGIDIAAWLAIGLVFGIAVTAMIYVFGHISWAHINPAVSIAMWATKRMPTNDMLAYVLAQFIGAVLASFSIVLIWGSRAINTGLGAPGMFYGVSYWQAILCEAVATFFLMLAIMGTAIDSRSPRGWAGLIIGLVVAGDIAVVGNITGSAINPARAFGPYLAGWLMGGTVDWWQYPIFVVGPILGALAAAFLYDYVSKADVTKSVESAKVPVAKKV
jgi:glycerol uptake facilitator protein